MRPLVVVRHVAACVSAAVVDKGLCWCERFNWREALSGVHYFHYPCFGDGVELGSSRAAAARGFVMLSRVAQMSMTVLFGCSPWGVYLIINVHMHWRRSLVADVRCHRVSGSLLARLDFYAVQHAPLLCMHAATSTEGAVQAWASRAIVLQALQGSA